MADKKYEELCFYPVTTINNDAILKLRVQQLASFVGETTYSVLLNFPNIFTGMNLKIQSEAIEKNVGSLGGTFSRTFTAAYYIYHPTTKKYLHDIKKSVTKFEKRAGFTEKDTEKDKQNTENSKEDKDIGDDSVSASESKTFGLSNANNSLGLADLFVACKENEPGVLVDPRIVYRESGETLIVFDPEELLESKIDKIELEQRKQKVETSLWKSTDSNTFFPNAVKSFAEESFVMEENCGRIMDALFIFKNDISLVTLKERLAILSERAAFVLQFGKYHPQVEKEARLTKKQFSEKVVVLDQKSKDVLMLCNSQWSTFWIYVYRKLKTDKDLFNSINDTDYVKPNNDAYEKGYKCVVSLPFSGQNSHLQYISGIESYYSAACEQIRIYFGRMGVNTTAACAEVTFSATRFVHFCTTVQQFLLPKSKNLFQFLDDEI
jgi:hypothetical protein